MKACQSFQQVWRRDWVSLLIVFLLAGSVFVFTNVLAKMYADKAWASVLGSLPIGLIVMFLLPLRALGPYSYGHMWTNAIEVFVALLLFPLLNYTKLKSNPAFAYDMVALALVVWALLNFVRVQYGTVALFRLAKIPVPTSCL